MAFVLSVDFLVMTACVIATNVDVPKPIVNVVHADATMILRNAFMRPFVRSVKRSLPDLDMPIVMFCAMNVNQRQE